MVGPRHDHLRHTVSIDDVIITPVGLLSDGGLFWIRERKKGGVMMVEPKLTTQHLKKFHVNAGG